jgi:MFS family permease
MNDTPMENERRFPLRWVVVGVSFSTLALTYTVMYSFSVFFVALLKEFGWSRSLTAGAFSLFWILHGIIGPFLGNRVDRWGAQWVFLVGSLLLGAALVLCSWIQSPWQFYLFFSVIAAVGVASTGQVPNTTIIQNWFTEKRGLAMGIISSGVGIGIFACVPSVQHLIDRVGWRMTYRLMAFIIPVSIMAMAIPFLRQRPWTHSPEGIKEEIHHPPVENSQERREGWNPRPWTLRGALRTRPFRILGLCFFFTGYINQSVLTHHVAFFVDQGGEALSASYIAGLVGLVSIAGKIFWGSLSDKSGREVAFTLVAACATCGMLLLITFTRSSSTKIPYLYALFFGMGYGGLATLLPIMTADFFAGSAYGAIFGTLYMLHGAGGAFGAWFAGFLFDQVGSYIPLLISVIVSALVACLVVWAAAPRKVRPVRRKKVFAG